MNVICSKPVISIHSIPKRSFENKRNQLNDNNIIDAGIKAITLLSVINNRDSAVSFPKWSHQGLLTSFKSYKLKTHRENVLIK